MKVHGWKHVKGEYFPENTGNFLKRLNQRVVWCEYLVKYWSSGKWASATRG